METIQTTNSDKKASPSFLLKVLQDKRLELLAFGLPKESYDLLLEETLKQLKEERD